MPLTAAAKAGEVQAVPKDLDEVVTVAIELANLFGNVFEDGKVNFADIPALAAVPGLFSDGMAAWEGKENIKISDFSGDVADAILRRFEDEVELPEGVVHIKEKVLAFVEAVFAIFAFAKLVIAPKK